MNLPLIFSIVFILGFIGGIVGGVIGSSLGTELSTSNFVTQAEFQNFTTVQNQTLVNMATALANRDLVLQNNTLQFVFDNWVAIPILPNQTAP